MIIRILCLVGFTFLFNHCNTTHSPSRGPNEVNPPAQSVDNGIQSQTLYFYPHLEIPPTSELKMKDTRGLDSKCIIELGNKKNGMAFNFSTEFYFKSLSSMANSFGFGGTLPMKDFVDKDTSYKNGLYQTTVPIPDFPDHKIRFFAEVDPNLKNVKSVSFEIRKGPASQLFENMALQARYKCLPEALTVSL